MAVVIGYVEVEIAIVVDVDPGSGKAGTMGCGLWKQRGHVLKRAVSQVAVEAVLWSLVEGLGLGQRVVLVMDLQQVEQPIVVVRALLTSPTVARGASHRSRLRTQEGATPGQLLCIIDF